MQPAVLLALGQGGSQRIVMDELILEMAAQGGLAGARRPLHDAQGTFHRPDPHDVHNALQVPQFVLPPNESHGLVPIPGLHQPAKPIRD